MRAQVVERRELARAQVLEVALEEADVLDGALGRERPSRPDVVGADVDADEARPGIRRGERGEGVAETRTEFGIVEIVPCGGRAAGQRCRRAKHRRIELGAELPHVGDLGEVCRDRLAPSTSARRCHKPA